MPTSSRCRPPRLQHSFKCRGIRGRSREALFCEAARNDCVREHTCRAAVDQHELTCMTSIQAGVRIHRGRRLERTTARGCGTVSFKLPQSKTEASMRWRLGPRAATDSEAATGRQRRLFAPFLASASRALLSQQSWSLRSFIPINVTNVATANSEMQHRLFSLVPAGLLSMLLALCLVPLAKADCTCSTSI